MDRQKSKFELVERLGLKTYRPGEVRNYWVDADELEVLLQSHYLAGDYSKGPSISIALKPLDMRVSREEIQSVMDSQRTCGSLSKSNEMLLEICDRVLQFGLKD